MLTDDEINTLVAASNILRERQASDLLVEAWKLGQVRLGLDDIVRAHTIATDVGF